MVIDLNAPIEPNIGLGGIKLRTRLADIQELIVEWVANPTTYVLDGPYEALYTFGQGEVTVGVDVRNGKIYKVIAGNGYLGKLSGLVSVGMRVGDATALIPELYYDEVYEAVRWRGRPGVWIDIPEIDPPPELVPPMSISSISVYAIEIDTKHNGDW